MQADPIDEEAEIITWLDGLPEERKKKKAVTMESYLARFDSLLNTLNMEIEKRSKAKEKGVRVLLSTRKQLKELRKDTPQLSRRRRARDPSLPHPVNSGFTKALPISNELAIFLKLNSDHPTLSRLEATRAICVYAHLKVDETREEILKWSYLNVGGKRNLQSSTNKKTIVPDKPLAKLLKYDTYVKDVECGKVTKKVTVNKDIGTKKQIIVTDPSLFYWTIQKLLSPHFVKKSKSV